MEGESKVSPKEGETVRKTLPFHQATRERRKEGGERGGEGLRACVRACVRVLADSPVEDSDA